MREQQTDSSTSRPGITFYVPALLLLLYGVESLLQFVDTSFDKIFFLHKKLLSMLLYGIDPYFLPYLLFISKAMWEFFNILASVVLLLLFVRGKRSFHRLAMYYVWLYALVWLLAGLPINVFGGESVLNVNFWLAVVAAAIFTIFTSRSAAYARVFRQMDVQQSQEGSDGN